MPDLRDRIAIVTGAAGGIGGATAAALADAGALVHALDLRADGSNGGPIVSHVADVTDAEAVAEIVKTVGAVDVLVCAAGVNVPQRRLAELTQASWGLLLGVNLTGVFNCIRAVLPTLRERRGHVVVIVSVSALWPDVSGPAYQASKAGVLGLIRAAALEERGVVRFTSILPGMVATDLLGKRPSPPSPAELEKCLRPEDVAATVRFALELPERACIAELTVLPSALQALGQT